MCSWNLNSRSIKREANNFVQKVRISFNPQNNPSNPTPFSLLPPLHINIKCSKAQKGL